jgi:hypothetical protein
VQIQFNLAMIAFLLTIVGYLKNSTRLQLNRAKVLGKGKHVIYKVRNILGIDEVDGSL